MEVTLLDHEIRNIKEKETVFYIIECKTKENQQWNVKKRYNDFIVLHSSVLRDVIHDRL